ncbi:hypothetical protein ACSFXN_07120 [Planococcus sp. 1R117A]|uniref:hypothetical protein n=1 Tax=Planococcus sp. 1R117A TaxID=3447020 RepID=UPI003EDC0A5B
MIKRTTGKINEIIYNNTAYYNGRYRYYPTISGLNGIIDEIIESNATTDYIRFTPFYINEQTNMQVEFEEYMFYLECRESVDEKIQVWHIKECLDPVDSPRALEDFELGAILYPLCTFNDTECYKKALLAYKKALSEMLLQMFDIAKMEMKLKEEDLPFGYFCFEIHSG